MAEAAAITIRRQVLDVEVFGTESDGMALQRRLPEVCARVLSPALESAFAPIDPGDAHLYVERLTIEVSGITVDQLETELAEAVRRAAAEFVRRNPLSPSGVADAPAIGDVRLRTAAQTVDDSLIGFLRTGRLPWSFTMPSGAQLEQLVLETWGIADPNRSPPPRMRARLSEVLAEPHGRARLAMQFTPEFVLIVLLSISPQAARAIEELMRALDEAHSPAAPSRRAFTTRSWDAAILAACAGRHPGPKDLARAAWRGLAGVEDGALATALERRWPGVTGQDDAQPVRDSAETVTPTTSRPLPSTELREETHGILVDNAGIILLHPFLPRLLEGLGVATDDRVLDPGRAVCLLHHLATGELIAPEYQLPLAKVLCGVPLDEPVEADVGLTDIDSEEVTALLEAAIGHWEVLRGTSPDSLRGEFLMRPGTLAVDADGDWLLRVEMRTVDILLDQLPWGISLVKLPWMRRLLRVEWR